MAYLNKALANFRAEINQRWPNRDKTSDGWIGDAAHQTRPSDHNPDPDGSVDAIDVDVDGIDVQLVLAAAIHHEATHYVIYDRRITSRTMTGGLGTWHTYYGSNPHTKHIHVSSRDTHENSTKPWFAPVTGGTPAPKPSTDWSDSLIMGLPILRQNSTGPDVRTWQGILVARGYSTKVDGDFGAATKRDTVALQAKYGAESRDGIVGPETWTIGLKRKDLR